MKIMITGGLGFIGHHLGPYLKEKGHSVVITDNFYHHITDERYNDFIDKRIEIIKNNNIHLEAADCRNSDTTLSLLKMHKPDTVIHLAATASAGLCNLDPKEGIDMGLMSFCGTLNAVRKYSKNIHVIYSSSSMVYGEFTKPVVKETDDLSPINVYGGSKLSCEILLKCYSKSYNIPYTIIRPSALYGSRCINRRVTQIFIENIIDFGKIKLSGGGESYLDFTDVRDLSQGIELIVRNPEKSRNQIFNLTYGNARKIKELIPILKEELGDFICETIPADKNVPKRGTLSIEKICNILEYKPKYSIELGYRDMIKWYNNSNWKKK